MKWIFIHGKNDSSKRSPSKAELDYILKLIEKFEIHGKVISFKSTKEIKRSLRVVAYQQFWLQDKVTNYVFDSQIQLFKLLPNKNEIDTLFKSKTGLSVIEFLNISYAVFLYYERENFGHDIKYDGFLDNDCFEYFNDRFGINKLRTFISLTKLEHVDDIVSLQKSSREIYQLYETNFLSTKPFVIVNGKIKTPHKAIFGQTCKHFIYDYLKANSKMFSVQFGKSMEKYIRLGLEEIRIKYIMEGQIKSRFTKSSNCADFFVGDDTLIESKAIELHPNAAVLRYSEVLSSYLKGSIVKAYCQLLNTAHCINPDGIFYGLIITYKEMYIGFGPDAWEEFLKIETDAFLSKWGINISILPPENICFIDLETWDYIVQVIKKYKCTIPEIIEKARIESKNFIDRKMLMDQVLKSNYKVKNWDLSYLSAAHKYIMV